MIRRTLLSKRIIFLKYLLCTFFFIPAYLTLNAQITWTGAAPGFAGNNWQDCRNWDLGRIPNIEDDVIIPSGLTNYPTEGVSDGVSMRTLIIQSGAEVATGGNEVFVDAEGANVAAAVVIEVGGALILRGGEPLNVRNATGDGILNQGLLQFAQPDEVFDQLIIENVNGVGLNNQGEVKFEEFGNSSEASMRIKNTGGASIVNSGSLFRIRTCSRVTVDNVILDNSGNLLNEGIIVETASGNSNINQNDGFIHNLGGGTFGITTNNGKLETNPNVIYRLECELGDHWWEDSGWSLKRSPEPDDIVMIEEGFSIGDPFYDSRFYNDEFLNYGSGAYTKMASLEIAAGQELSILCGILEVGKLKIAGELQIGDTANGYAGKIIVTDSFINTGTVINEGEIVNLTGSILGGMISGIGIISNEKAPITWTGVSNDDWDNAANWSGGIEPDSGDHIYIPPCTTCPKISSAGNEVASILLEGSLQIENGGALMVDGIGQPCDATALIISGGTLTNLGTLKVVNAQRAGIQNHRGTIENYDHLEISATGAQGITALYEAEMTNHPDAVLKLFDIGSIAYSNVIRSSLHNEGLIDIDTTETSPDLSGINSGGDNRGMGISSIKESLFENTGEIHTLNLGSDAIHIRRESRFINTGYINAIKSDNDGIEIDAYSYFHNTISGRIEITRTGSESLEADEGSHILNEGYMHIDFGNIFLDGNGAEVVLFDETSGMINRGELIVTNAGSEFMEVDEGSYFINEAGATFRGDMAFEEGLEIDENSKFINYGLVELKNMGNEGIENDETSTLENYGTINLINIGLQNDPRGSLNPSTDREGIDNKACSYFFNAGTISITNEEELNSDPLKGINIGIQNDLNARFENFGSITINHADSLGLINRNHARFVNAGDMLFLNVSDTALLNRAKFENQACGFISALDGFVNGEEVMSNNAPISIGDFTNEGGLEIGSFFVNRANFVNNGSIADPDGVASAASAGGNIVSTVDDFPEPPDYCEKTCDILSVTVGEQLECDSQTGTYTQEIIVEYVGGSINGQLLVEIDGEGNFLPFEPTGSPQTIGLTIPTNGQEYDIFVKFSGDNGCTFNTPNLFTAPQNCILSCAILAMTAGAQTACDTMTNTYNQEVMLIYEDEPNTGNLIVGGQVFDITGSPQLVTLTNLTADGNPVDITAYFSENNSCQLTENGLFTAPDACSESQPPVVEGIILFVVKDANNMHSGDVAVKTQLENTGYTVEVVGESASQTSDADGKVLVLISNTVASSAVNTKFTNEAIPVVCYESLLFDDLGMTNGSNGSDFGQDSNELTIDIDEPSHPMAGELSGEPQIYTNTGDIIWGNPNSNAIKVASTQGWYQNQWSIFGYETGASMVSGIAPARRASLFFKANQVSKLNANGWALFDAVICWATGCETARFAPEASQVPSIKAYPNPFKNSLKIEWSNHAQEVHLIVKNLLGQKVFAKKVSLQGRFELSTANLPNGLYILQVIGDGFKQEIKVVKE